ncbi:unnamed protein product [Closterium sp. Yama58-4]|nr:unnamed protein product [Closterium sp. Yama58-4]
MGDVSWALPANSRNPANSKSSTGGNPIVNATLTVTVTASAAVAQPCRLCGGFQQLPCQVLQAAVRLTAVLVPVTLKQPQPGQPLQDPAPSGAATAVVPVAPVAPAAAVAAAASVPAVVVSFVRGPRGVAKVGRARFSWKALESTGVHSPARCDACTFLCKLDALPSFPCPRGWFTARGLTDGPHRFTVTALKGAPGVTGTRLQAAAAAVGMGGEGGGGAGAKVEAQAQATYAWTVDAASPVPTLTVDPPQAREGSVQISIAFDKPCPGLQCNATACDIEASPQGIVAIDPSSPGSCADSNGRAWMAGFDSYAVIRIDRAPLEATLSCDTPLAVVKFFTQLRATPRVSQSPVTCRVLFSKPVSAFSSASLAVVNATTSDPQAVNDLEYQFQVWPTGEGSVVVDIRHDNVTDAAGNTCQPTQPFFFFFDTTPPTVQLSVSETSATTDWVYPILVAFSEPVLGFNSSSIQLSNGVITCWTGVDRGLGRYYEVTVAAVSDGDVTVSVPGATVVDIAGNFNSPSNTLSLTHYAPGDAGSIAAWVVTAVVGWTALSTAAVSLAVTIKESDPTSSPGIRIVSNRPFRAVSTPVVGADPSRNILRMALHMQVFALTQNLAVRVLPLFYRQLTGGLRWTYFYIPAPFKGSFDGWKGVYSSPTEAPGQDNSTAPPSCAPHYLATKTDSAAASSANPSDSTQSKLSFWPFLSSSPSPLPLPFPPPSPLSPSPPLPPPPSLSPSPLPLPFPPPSPLPPSYSPPSFPFPPFLVRPLPSSSPPHGSNYFSPSLSPLSPLFPPPPPSSFEHMEPGGTAAGLATGVIVLCLWPVLFLIFSFSVVWYIVVQEQFARFFVREMTEPRNNGCIASFARAFWAALRQKRLKGHWVTITPSQKHILPRFGIFFEDFTVWGSVGAWGVLKDRLRAAYGTLDFLKMVRVAAYGTLDFLKMVSAAAYGIRGLSKNGAGGGAGGGMEPDRQCRGTASMPARPRTAAPALPALPPASPAGGAGSEMKSSECAVVSQYANLFGLKSLSPHPPCVVPQQPFTERGLQVVEAVSSGAEVVLFACALAMAIDWDMSSNFAGTLGLVMVIAVGLAFIGQLFNHWVALGQQINRMLNPPDDERSPSHRSDGDDFSDNDDDDLDDDDDDEDFDDEDDGNGDEDEDDDDDDDYDDDEDDDEGDTSLDEAERNRQQQQHQQQHQ